MPSKVVTIGYLKTFVSGILSVSTAYNDDRYCPTYAELTGGSLVTNYKSDTNPTKTTNGIRINGCSVGTSYSSNQLVVEPDLQLLYQQLQSISVSAAKTTVGCCATSTTLSSTAYFKLVTKTTGGTSTASTSTSASVSASYSEDESFTSISGNKISFTKNTVNTSNCTGAPARSSEVTGSYTYSGTTKTNTVTITQSANNIDSYWTNTSTSTYDVSVSPTSMSFGSAGGTKSYTVTRHYTQYQEKYDDCGTAVCFNSYNTSTTVTPSSASASGDFTCTKSNVSIGVNSGSARSGTLTVSYGGYNATCSLSQSASQAGTTNGEPYNYDYYLSVSTPSGKISCDGGSATFTARYVTTWDYDWETKNDAGEVTNSGTSSDSSSTNVTNSAEWSTTVGSVSKGTLTLGAYDEDTRRTATVTAKYNGYSDSDYVYQESCAPDTPITPPATPCMTIFYTISNGAAATVYFKTTNGTQEGSHEVDAQGSQQLCNIAEGTELVVSCNNGDVTVGGDTSFTFYSGTTASISLTKSGGGSTPTITYSYSGKAENFGNCETSTTVKVYEKASTASTWTDITSNVTPTLKYKTNNTSYATAATPNSGSTSVVWSVQITFTRRNESQSVVANATQDAGPCNTGSTSCTCSVTSISVSPSAHTFTSEEDYEFKVTINDNSSTCSKCNGGFKVYDSNGLVVESGTTSFTLSNQSGTFTIKANDNTSKTCTLTTTKYTEVVVYQYTFKNCYSNRQLALFASNATPSGSNTNFAMLAALDGTSAIVTLPSNSGMMVNGSSNSMGGTAKIGDKVKVYSCQGTSSWTLEETITLTAANRSFEYGCSSAPTSCTCSVTSISVNPSAYTFTSDSSKSFSVTINDNSSTCSKCNGGFKVYNSSGTYVTSGTSTFSLSNQSGTFTIKANDNTSKTCTLTTTKYTAPPTSCTCSVTSISVNPSAYTFTSRSEKKDFTVTISNNGCDKCRGYFLYNPDGIYMGPGTNNAPFTLYGSSQSGDYKVVAMDNTGITKTVKVVADIPEDPVYVFKFNNPTGGFDSTSTETHIIHKPNYEGGGPTTTLTSTKDGSNVGYTMSSDVNWITTSTASTTCSWEIKKNTSSESRSGTITLTQSGSNKTLTISVTQGGAPAPTTCTTLNTWSSISASVSAGKCDTKPSVSVTASGTHTNSDCSTASTSVTLSSSDYTIKYGNSSSTCELENITVNNTSSEVTWHYQVTASSTYGGKTTVGSFKQAAGPCSTYTNGITVNFPYRYGGYFYLSVVVNGETVRSGYVYNIQSNANEVKSTWLGSFETTHGDSVSITLYGVGYLDKFGGHYLSPYIDNQHDSYSGDWSGIHGTMEYTSTKGMYFTMTIPSSSSIGDGGGGGIITPSPDDRV